MFFWLTPRSAVLLNVLSSRDDATDVLLFTMSALTDLRISFSGQASLENAEFLMRVARGGNDEARSGRLQFELLPRNPANFGCFTADLSVNAHVFDALVECAVAGRTLPEVLLSVRPRDGDNEVGLESYLWEVRNQSPAVIEKATFETVLVDLDQKIGDKPKRLRWRSAL